MNKIERKKIAMAILEADSWKRIEDYAVEQNMHTHAVIIKAYVSELYLKGILLMCNRTWKNNTHRLKVLYDLLPEKIRKIVKNNTENELKRLSNNNMNNKTDKSFFPMKIYDPTTNNLLIEIKSFGVALEKISNNFVDLRYNFDKVNQNENIKVILFSFIDTFERILKEVAYDIYNQKTKSSKK